MKIGLQSWYRTWLKEHERTNLIYAGGASGDGPRLDQVNFVRDRLGHQLVWGDVPFEDREKEPAPNDDQRVTAWVIGEHRSKSVRLPVYLIERPDLGVRFVLRDNFHDWNVTVVAEKPVETDLRGFELDFRDEEERMRWVPGGYWSYLLFQGFPNEFCCGPYSLNKRRFSLSIYTREEVYMLIALILRDLRMPK